MRVARLASGLLLAGFLLSPVEQVAGASVATTSLVDRTAPGFTVKILEGKQVSLADFHGRAVLVNFWATWCGACKLEMPWLAKLREEYAAQGFEVLGIVTDDASPSAITALVRKYGVKYPILRCNHATAQVYGGLPELPASFFIDRHGRVVAEIGGADSSGQIEAKIKLALAH